MRSEKIAQRERIFLIVISLLTLFFAVVGATFAYFTIVVRGNEEASSVYLKSVKLGQVIFEDGQEIALTDVYPGEFASKSFTVKSVDNDVDIKIKYNVFLVQSRNEFAANNIAEFMHEVTDSSKLSTSDESKVGTLSLSTVPSPASTAPIISGTLYGNDVHTYTYRIGLLEANSNQNDAQGLTFLGKLQVSIEEGNRYTSGGNIWSSSSN